jgi:hypothetical protein
VAILKMSNAKETNNIQLMAFVAWSQDDNALTGETFFGINRTKGVYHPDKQRLKTYEQENSSCSINLLIDNLLYLIAALGKRDKSIHFVL